MQKLCEEGKLGEKNWVNADADGSKLEVVELCKSQTPGAREWTLYKGSWEQGTIGGGEGELRTSGVRNSHQNI